MLERAAARRPDRPAVEDEHGRTLTYAELDRAADRLATRLARWGVGRGDRVGLLLPKSLEAVAAIHGILRAGAAYVPVDPTAPAARGAGILADARVKAVVVAAELAPRLRRELARSRRPAPADRRRRPSRRGPPPGDAPLGRGHGRRRARAPAPRRATADDLAYILFTSGSTGKPKGVMLSHANAFTLPRLVPTGTFATRPTTTASRRTRRSISISRSSTCTPPAATRRRSC